LFLTGKIDPVRTVALAGSQVKAPQYYKITQGSKISDIVSGKLTTLKSRIISGNPLTGTSVSNEDPIGFYDDVISVLPEGDHYSFLGWVPFIGNNKFEFVSYILLLVNAK